MLKLRPSNQKRQAGNAIFEVIPILLLFVLMINFMLGFFGAIHSGILNSIAARNYAFETFRNRANLNYFRDVVMPSVDLADGYMTQFEFRYHTIVSDVNGGGEDWVATKRPIKFSDISSGTYLRAPGSESTIHIGKDGIIKINSLTTDNVSDQVKGLTPDTSYEDFTSVWVRTVYGMCLTCDCAKGIPDAKCH